MSNTRKVRSSAGWASQAEREASRLLGEQMSRGAVLLRPGSVGHKVRNVQTGRVLPCCWDDCMRDGDDRIRVEVPHEQPRWRNEKTGEQEMLVYIFCTEEHRGHWLKSQPVPLG